MAKGFVIPKAKEEDRTDLRKERDAVCTTYKDTLIWANSYRPGATPIGGGRKRRLADFQRGGYEKFRNDRTKLDKHFRMPRATAPREGTIIKTGPSEKAIERLRQAGQA